ncbi:MAG: hypothetical protein ACQESE_05320 [Nanobdellota archaeon]
MKLDNHEKKRLDDSIRQILEYKNITENFSYLMIEELSAEDMFVRPGMAIFTRIDLEPTRTEKNQIQTVNVAIGYNSTPIMTEQIHSVPITYLEHTSTIKTEKQAKRLQESIFDSYDLKAYQDKYKVLFQYAFVSPAENIFKRNTYNPHNPPILMKRNGPDKAERTPWHQLNTYQLEESNIDVYPIQEYVRDSKHVLAFCKMAMRTQTNNLLKHKE